MHSCVWVARTTGGCPVYPTCCKGGGMCRRMHSAACQQADMKDTVTYIHMCVHPAGCSTPQLVTHARHCVSIRSTNQALTFTRLNTTDTWVPLNKHHGHSAPSVPIQAPSHPGPCPSNHPPANRVHLSCLPANKALDSPPAHTGFTADQRCH